MDNILAAQVELINQKLGFAGQINGYQSPGEREGYSPVYLY